MGFAVADSIRRLCGEFPHVELPLNKIHALNSFAVRTALRSTRRVLIGASVVGSLLVCQAVWARGPHAHWHARLAPPTRMVNAILLTPGSLPVDEAALPVDGAKYELKLHHLHSGESIDVVYRIGDTYIPEAIAKLDYFLRDSRTQDEKAYDPREFDVLHNVLARLGRPDGVIDIVCGYRTPWSNNFLRTRSRHTGVAKNSQHVEAKAIDIRVPGVRTRALRDVALSLDAGGVGYYPRSQFVHVDVGPVRQWTFGGRGED